MQITFFLVPFQAWVSPQRRMQPHRKINAAAASASPERGGELANLRHARSPFGNRYRILLTSARRAFQKQHQLCT